MALVHLNRNTILRNLTIGALAVGLSMGGTAWAGPRKSRQETPYPQPGKIYRQIPSDHHTVRVGSDQYLYREGIYPQNRLPCQRIAAALPNWNPFHGITDHAVTVCVADLFAVEPGLLHRAHLGEPGPGSVKFF